MPVKTYSLSVDGDKRLSKNFIVREFACNDGCESVLIDDELIRVLQEIREHFGVAVRVNSAYRTPAHNARIKGSPTSQHIHGTAADISLHGVPPLAVCQYAEFILNNKGGVGVYRDFTHIDVRLSKSRWDERSGIQVSVSGFPGYSENKTALSDNGQAGAGHAKVETGHVTDGAGHASDSSKSARTQLTPQETGPAREAGQEPAPMEPMPAPKTPVIVYKPDGVSTVTLEGFNMQGSVYVQVRALSETLGHMVDWDGKQVTVK